jgi:ribosomal protein L11 methyltransferase
MSKWIELSMVVDGEAAEAVAEALRRYGHQGVVIEQRLAEDEGLPGEPLPAGPLTVRAYLPDDADAPQKRRKIEEALYYLGRLYPLPEPTFTAIDEADWAEAWKANYHPVRVGRRLLVKPAWVEATVAAEDVLIELDPGMAFGTGTHPSTQLCLMAAEDLVGPKKRVLDLGCGSGILAIASAKLGASEVLGLDVDPVAVRVARENVRANGVVERVTVQQGSLEDAVREGQRFDLVLVNILAKVIVEMCDHGLAETVQPGGYLVAAGIIEDQADEVAGALQKAGLLVEARRPSADWVALVARHPPPPGQANAIAACKKPASR